MTYNKEVIEFKSPPKVPWRFYEYRSPSGELLVNDWFWNDISDAARFAIRDGLKDAVKTENHFDWLCWKKYLKGGDLQKYKIWELEFSCGDNIQYRLAGIFGPERKQATILIGFCHKGNVYTPPDALNTAVTRTRQIADRTATFIERPIPTDR